MSIQQERCVVASCDVCENPFEYDDTTVHFPDDEVGRKELRAALLDADWEITDDRLVCDPCVSERPHQFVPMGEGYRIRWCRACGHNVDHGAHGPVGATS